MKIGVVTGASSGIGKEFVYQIPGVYSEIEELWIISRNENKLLNVKKNAKIPCRILPFDLCKEQGIRSYQKKLKEEKPEIMLLVNSAGYGKTGKFEEISCEENCEFQECCILVLKNKEKVKLSMEDFKEAVNEVLRRKGYREADGVESVILKDCSMVEGA